MDEPCLRAKYTNAIKFISMEKKALFLTVDSFGERRRKKRKQSCPLCEDVKFIILQIMSRKTLFALIRVKLVFYLCLQVS